jgi:hypothetical protein
MQSASIGSWNWRKEGNLLFLQFYEPIDRLIVPRQLSDDVTASLFC